MIVRKLDLPLEALITLLTGPPSSRFDDVLCQMEHLSYKNWDCGCPRNAAIAVMARNRHADDDPVTVPIRRNLP